MQRLIVICLVALLLALGSATTAAAQNTALTAGKGTVSATLGYGIYVGEGDGNPYGLGLGVRGGYTLDMNLYVGGLFNFFVGETDSVGGVDSSARFIQIAAEVGYDIAVESVVIRPSLGIGAGIFSVSTSGSVAGVDLDSSDSETYLLLAPGANVIVPLGGFFVGGELRYFWIPTEDYGDGLLIAANVGAIF